MTQVPLKTTDHLVIGDTVFHPLTDQPVVIKEITEVAYDLNRFDVRFEAGPIVLGKHAAALWRMA